MRRNRTKRTALRSSLSDSGIFAFLPVTSSQVSTPALFWIPSHPMILRRPIRTPDYPPSVAALPRRSNLCALHTCCACKTTNADTELWTSDRIGTGLTKLGDACLWCYSIHQTESDGRRKVRGTWVSLSIPQIRNQIIPNSSISGDNYSTYRQKIAVFFQS